MRHIPLQIGLIGSKGKLGKAIALLLEKEALTPNPNYVLQASFCRESPLDATQQVDVLIDVSTPSCLSQHLNLAQKAGLPIVIGTTGHQDLSLFQTAALHIPVFYAPNFSLGFCLLKQLALKLVESAPSLVQIDLTETHHTQKKDAPSGSALLLKEALSSQTSLPLSIESIREGEVIGQHSLSVRFGQEEISLCHTVHDRITFAQGALKAAAFLAKAQVGLYGMEHLI